MTLPLAILIPEKELTMLIMELYKNFEVYGTTFSHDNVAAFFYFTCEKTLSDIELVVGSHEESDRVPMLDMTDEVRRHLL